MARTNLIDLLPPRFLHAFAILSCSSSGLTGCVALLSTPDLIVATMSFLLPQVVVIIVGRASNWSLARILSTSSSLFMRGRFQSVSNNSYGVSCNKR